MAVTELAQLRLEPGASLGDPSLKSKLVKATKAMESFDGHPFYWYTQIEDPSIFYIVGSWTSVQRHRQEWLPSAANQELLELLGGLVIVDWMFHVQVAQHQLPLDAPVMAISRHSIKPGAHVGFEEKFQSVKHHVANYTAPRGVAGGWRVEKEAESQEEWLLFTGWPDAAKHSEFAETPAFAEYASIKNFVQKFEVKQAAKLDLEAMDVSCYTVLSNCGDGPEIED